MSNKMKTYFLVPNFHLIPPPNGPLALGSIITSPGTPERILNKTTHILISADSVYTSHQTNWLSTRSELTEAKIGVWTSFLQLVLGINVDADLNYSRRNSEQYQCEDLETSYFQPNEEFISECLKNTAVKSYMEKTWWRKPVYMVTGMKVARGASMESVEKSRCGGAARIGVDITAVTGGIPVSGGPTMERHMEKKEHVKWEGSEDFVFAYRLVRIKLKGKEGGFVEKDFNKGALYNEDEEDETMKDNRDAKKFMELWNVEDVSDVEEGIKEVAVINVFDDAAE